MSIRQIVFEEDFLKQNSVNIWKGLLNPRQFLRTTRVFMLRSLAWILKSLFMQAITLASESVDNKKNPISSRLMMALGRKCKVNKKIAKHAAAKSCQTFQLFTVRVHTSGQDASKQEAIKMQSGGKIQGSHHYTESRHDAGSFKKR